jgi:hypothetical protein
MFVRSLIVIPFVLSGCATVAPHSRKPASVRTPETVEYDRGVYELATLAADEKTEKSAPDYTGTVDPIGDGSPVDWRRSPLGSFCRENFRVGMADYVFDIKETELQRQLANGTVDFADVMPWQVTLYPDERILRLNHERKFFLTGDGDGRGGFPETDSILTILGKVYGGSLDDSKKVWPKDATARIREQERLSSTASELDQKKDFDQASKAFILLCANYDLFNAVDCKNALGKVVDLMKPVKDVSLFPLVKEIVSDPVYAYTAITLAKIVEVRLENPAYPNGNLFDDAVYAFRAHGLSDAAAREHTFKLLALYSTNGANTASFLEPFISEANRGLFYGLGVIGTAIPLLDWRTFASGHPYAFPPSVHATCDNMKPYHFWMAAYLARETGRSVGDSAAGRQATYIAELGYQMRAETAARDPNRPFTVGTFEPGNNKIRMDLAWGAAGAAYGAASIDRPNPRLTFDVDASLTAMLNAAHVKKPLSATEASHLWDGYGSTGYLRWTRMFQPKLGLQKVRVTK